MKSLNWTKLDERWKNQLLVIVFKCLQGSAPSYLSSQFIFTECMHTKGTRSQSSKTLVVPLWKNTLGKRTFHYRGTKLWNNLPVGVRLDYDSLSLHMFKNAIV